MYDDDAAGGAVGGGGTMNGNGHDQTNGNGVSAFACEGDDNTFSFILFCTDESENAKRSKPENAEKENSSPPAPNAMERNVASY